MDNRYSIRALGILASLFTAACQPSLGDMTDGESGGDDAPSSTDDPTGGGGEYMPCSAANPCPDGQFCFNGLCALGCNSDGDCAADQYCDTEGDRLCHNKTVSTCPEVPCAEGQACVNGFCSTEVDQQCQQMPNGEDGCASDALCIEEPDQPEAYKCYTFPACAADDTCPVGTEGAVCNDGLLTNKDKICLIGMCTGVEHCPADWTCVKFQGEVIGLCSSGALGYPCGGPADCDSGNCVQPLPGVPGVCG